MLVLLANYCVLAQSFPGYRSGNYTGVNGVFFNPANIADSRYKWDVNVFGIDGLVGNDQNKLSFKDITKSSFNEDSLKSKLLRGSGDNLEAMSRIDILGPSGMWNLGRWTGMAVTTRGRVWANARDINGRLAGAILDAGVPRDNYPFNFNMQRAVLNTVGWTEIGVSAAHVFTKKPGTKHFFKGGLTLKYIAGIANASLEMVNFNGTVNNGTGGTYLTNTVGRISLNTTEANFDDYDFGDFFEFNGHGVGGDIGIVYEYRPVSDYSKYTNDRWATRYKLKVGVSVLDIGQIKFSQSGNQSGTWDANIPNGQQFLLSQFNDKNIGDYEDILDASAFFSPVGVSENDYKISLPTTILAQVDYNIAGPFFMQAAAQIATTKTNGLNLFAYNAYFLTPRVENARWGISVPLSYSELSSFNAGVSLRFGPVFLGSGSVISSIFDSKQADLHFGVRFGMPYKKKEKPDTDKDGVYDDVDKCPTIPGVARYQGCPVPDADKDGINDEQDSCLNEPGLAKYNGCPIPDRDKDGVNDEIDECPDEPGSGQFRGCPDTDGDGIPDKEDKCPRERGLPKYQGCPPPDRDGDGVNDDEDACPDKPGPVSSKGCPVEDVVIRITADFKNILFDFNKATIRPESLHILDSAASIMNQQIPNSNFYIDGYTDNKGSVAVNKRISKQRAQAVADALAKAGVGKSRLIARGFGKDNPKCSNATEEGRQCNRRVEVIIRNIDQKKVQRAGN